MEKEKEIKEGALLKDKEEEEEGVIVIQYLEASMSNELLCKYADNSAFDFDYSQSSIWSPLVPRFHSCLNPKSPDFNRPRRLSFDKISLSTRIQNKISTFGCNFNARVQNKKMKMLKFNNKNDSSGFQSPPSQKKVNSLLWFFFWLGSVRLIRDPDKISPHKLS